MSQDVNIPPFRDRPKKWGEVWTLRKGRLDAWHPAISGRTRSAAKSASCWTANCCAAMRAATEWN